MALELFCKLRPAPSFRVYDSPKRRLPNGREVDITHPYRKLGPPKVRAPRVERGFCSDYPPAAFAVSAADVRLRNTRSVVPMPIPYSSRTRSVTRGTL